MARAIGATRFRFWLCLIALIGVIVPRRLRAEWKQEWEAELRCREALLADWDKLNWKTKLDLLRRSLGAFWDALWLQQLRWEDEMIQDLRFGLRMLIKRPAFTIIAVLSLALGTGANTAIFSFINALLLRPLPIERPGELVSLNTAEAKQAFPAFSYPNYKDFRDRNEVFSGLIGYRFTPLSMSHDGINERVWGFEVSGNYFDVLGVDTILGRTISLDDDRAAGASPVAVMSYKCWQQRFGGDQNVIGRDVIVNGRSFTIVGVAPRAFFGTEVVSQPDLWFPMSMEAQLEIGSNWLDDREAKNVFLQGRLKPGVSVTQAQTALNLIAMDLEREYPNINEGKRVELSPPGLMGLAMRGPVMGFSGLLMAVVGLVLLLACINLANLLLARAADRRREIAVRLALGASRFRLVRQLLTESLMLAFCGGALGLLPAAWLVNLAAALKVPPNIPLSFDIHIDYRVFIFTLFLSLGTGVLFGLLPALQATKTDLVPALKDEPSFGGHRKSWLKSSLIVFQISLSLMLLVGGGLMMRSLAQAQAINLGFDPKNALEVAFDLRLQGYESVQGKEFQKRVLDRVRALPGVQVAGIADMIPVDLHFSRTAVFIEGQPPERTANTPSSMINRASPQYFQAMGTRLLAGRDFTEQDDQNSPRVAIVNEAFARRFFPSEDPMGKRFSLGRPESAKNQVIGVVEDGKYAALNEGPRPFVCRPLWQAEVGATSVIVRTDGDPQRMIGAVSRDVQELDPHLPISSNTLFGKLDVPLLPARIAASLLGGFGLLALALAAIGIYGVISYAVSTRTHEIGIRMALGAEKSDVLRLVLGQGLKLVLIGIGIGLFAAFGVTQFMKAILFGVSATDPLTFAIASIVLGTVALLACYFPARRATRVDPMVALRHE
jgi:macrolide transport system ATP-binding/permease protein